MIDMIIALKECLGLILLTGLVTGYLYTLLSTRETYLPRIGQLKQEIETYNKESESLKTASQQLQEKIEAEQADAIHEEEENHKLQATISSLQEKLTAAEEEKETLLHSYQKTNAHFRDYKEKEETLQKEISDTTVTDLLAHETEQYERIKTLQEQIAQETERIEETRQRVARLSSQKEELESKYNHLKETVHDFHKELTQKETLAKTLEQNIQQKIASLESEYHTWQEKIKTCKEKLLALKESR